MEDEEGGTRKEEEQPLGGGVGSAIGRNLGKKNIWIPLASIQLDRALSQTANQATILIKTKM